MSRIETLTAHQEDQLAAYRERWWQILTSTQNLDLEAARESVSKAYRASGLPQPQIIFCQGPQDFLDYVNRRPLSERLLSWGPPLLQLPIVRDLSIQCQDQLTPAVLIALQEALGTLRLTELTLALYSAVLDPFVAQLPEFIDRSLVEGTQSSRWLEQIADTYWQQQQQFWRQEISRQPGGDWLIQRGEELGRWMQPLGHWWDQEVMQPLRHDPLLQELEASLKQMLGFLSLLGFGVDALGAATNGFAPALIDYCNEVLGCSLSQEPWQALRSLYINCGTVLTFQRVSFIFERPTQLCFDEEGRLHGEGEPALAFNDGYARYCFRGVNLPPRYGPIHPNLWRADWILTEQNAELRRVLIQGIGYSRLCQELDAEILDRWREYSLLRIDHPVDIEPIFLLKMTCPSTGYIHATRVPPDLRSAREAIRWVNWDIDPEDFSVES
ncbi:DUF6745 domain-containing protein [Lyngbya confervoides]|uniref:DUF6745 domain-containing protein n=1 Tax=Lyngbya confervoides BDU141951 TaxID=1574623 RepID=A0ABD4T4X9_9CYAN|nr:hypothetical protein [Lyngbya confervoides]MCM1983292.1 hypothetical protein [Lyngbya confervoides BDU141951]